MKAILASPLLIAGWIVCEVAGFIDTNAIFVTAYRTVTAAGTELHRIVIANSDRAMPGIIVTPEGQDGDDN